jgi:hypothetical protein
MKTTDTQLPRNVVEIRPFREAKTAQKTLRRAIEDLIEDLTDGEGCLLADGYDEAFLGLTEDNGAWRAVYSIHGCIDVLMERDGMSEEGAKEFFSFNVLDADMGPQTPIFVWYVYARLPADRREGP